MNTLWILWLMLYQQELDADVAAVVSDNYEQYWD